MTVPRRPSTLALALTVPAIVLGLVGVHCSGSDATPGGARPSPVADAAAPSDSASSVDPDASAIDAGATDAADSALPGDRPGLTAAYSINTKIVSSYATAAPLFTVVRLPDLAKTDVLQRGQGAFPGGTPDVDLVGAFIAAAGPNAIGLVTKVYDQSGHGYDATQTNLASAPMLVVDALAPASSSLSLLFSNSLQTAQAAYATDLSNGNALIAGSVTAGNPATLTFAPSPPPSVAGYEAGAPFPHVPSPERWIRPGFIVTDKSLGDDGGLPVISTAADHVVLDGQAQETTKFGKTIDIAVPEVWLDLPAALTTSTSAMTAVIAARAGNDGTLDFLTFGGGASGDAGIPAYSTIACDQHGNLINAASDSSSSTTTTLVTAPIFSNDLDVYAFARSGTTVRWDFGEQGAGDATDAYASTVSLTGGRIGVTPNIKGNSGSFEAAGILVFDTPLATTDLSAVAGALRRTLAIPAVPPDVVVYAGASTVVGHGISIVEAPAKRMGESLVHAGTPVRTYTASNLTENLLDDLQSGGSGGAVTQIGQHAAGKKILVIHPTISDSFGRFGMNGGWPSQCGDAGGPTEYPACLWTIVRDCTAEASAKGWSVVLVGGEPKAAFFANGLSPEFLAFKRLEAAGYASAGAAALVDLESNDFFGGSDGQGHPSHCPFWNSACVGYSDPKDTQAIWQPDGDHFNQSGYDLSADVIVPSLASLLH